MSYPLCVYGPIFNQMKWFGKYMSGLEN